ncbi:MAG: VacJ family lipoprotein [Pseudohongiella sp.]|uniref:VacJ family lipoprotein n=1 Tax=Pseudohongiella sp. TaxID=1979412 RepID=UPI0034A01F30
MQYPNSSLLVLALAGGLSLSMTPGSVSAQQAPEYDPFEPVNVKVHAFNDYVDRKLLRPVANGYIRYVPLFARQGVSNFFSNINNISVLANNLLQFKLEDAANDTGRLMFNTSMGIGGLFDVASWVGFAKNDEDFGQTLGYWGVPAGPYIVLPLFGPSTVRDGFGFATDTFTNPLNYREDVMLRNAAFVLQQVDRRVDAMSVDSLMSGDPYIFTREAYLQQREYLVKDGEVADQADDWGDWD